MNRKSILLDDDLIKQLTKEVHDMHVNSYLCTPTLHVSESVDTLFYAEIGVTYKHG